MSNPNQQTKYTADGQPLSDVAEGAPEVSESDEITDPSLPVPPTPEEWRKSWPLAEQNLLLRYDELIPALDVGGHMVHQRGRTVDDPSLYHVVPLSTNAPYTPTLGGFGRVKPEDEGIMVTYDSTLKVYLDTTIGLGLTKYDSVSGVTYLIAVAAIGIDAANRLIIPQLQAVTGTRVTDGAVHTATGLYDGFLWRHTLVRLCETLAAEIGASAVVVRSHKNNAWKKVQDDGWAQYDKVAKELHYTQGVYDTTGDWVKLLSPE